MFIPWFNRDIPILSYLDLLWYINLKPDASKSKDRGGNTPTPSPQITPTSWGVSSVRSAFSWISPQSQSGRTPSPTVIPPPTNATSISSSGRSRLFGLTIGINNYDHQRKLHGAVDDADSFKTYLQMELKVPSDHLINLRNRQASRHAIIAAFRALESDVRIEKGDPIVIYYAGHGGEQGGDNSAEKIETIVPQDYSREKGKEVKPIPDRTIAALLNDLAEKKGNNITVILDCCHSGSGTREMDDEDDGDVEGEDPNCLSRVANLGPDDVTPELDESICGSSRGTRITKGFAHKDLRSHVLLAACSANELAREDVDYESGQGKGRGRFTNAFLKLLRKVGPEQLTYLEVLDRLDHIVGQNPQCEGFYRDRYLFDAKAPSPSRLCYEVTNERGVITLAAGAAHGVTAGAQFALYQDKSALLTQSVLGVVTTQKISPFSTTLNPVDAKSRPRQFTNPAIALQTKVGVSEELALHVPLDQRLLPVFEALVDEMKGTGANPCKIVLVDTKDRNKATLEIVIDDYEKVAFNVLDDRALKYGFKRMPYTVEPDIDDIKEVLRAAAHYYFHLNRAHLNSQIQNKISIEFAQLEESEENFDEFGRPLWAPCEDNLIHDGVLDFVVDESGSYGIKVTNNTPWDLYPSVFFFDNSELRVASYYACAVNKKFKVDAPLKKDGGVLTLGYGSSGTNPFEYYLPEGQSLDFGFLKFFLSTEPVDLSFLVQESPFQGGRGMRARDQPPPPAWGTILIPVIQRRG